VDGVSACRSCGAEVFWAVTASGKRMPVDADVTADGNVSIGPDGLAYVVPAGHVASPAYPRYTSHFATCPNAAHHRRTS
jgi:hypothetical protein